jgi:hypothetical protein
MDNHPQQYQHQLSSRTDSLGGSKNRSRLPHYERADDLCVIACYFNWYRYRTRERNLRIFVDSLRRSKIRLIIIECAGVPGQFELPAGTDVIHVTSRSIAWQKERLLNIALRYVPRRYSKIAWIDADVLFESATWAQDASSLLQRYVVVQLFEIAVRLPPNALLRFITGDHYRSFASVHQSHPNVLLNGVYDQHGHTGFAWAARRDFVDAHGFYDVCVAGSGDHAMAHAFCGDWESPCIIRTFGTGAMLEHFTSWCERMYRDVRAQVGVVPGRLLHLWHGTVENRRYGVRTQEIVKMAFNPYEDLVLNDFGCWEWSAHREDLRLWGDQYFLGRREDELCLHSPTVGRRTGF